MERVVVKDSKTISADLNDRTNMYNLHELHTNYCPFSEPDLMLHIIFVLAYALIVIDTLHSGKIYYGYMSYW